MSEHTAVAASVAAKIKERDFSAAYRIYFSAMEGGISECPLDMIAFSEQIESQVSASTWEEWEEWTWDHESSRS